MPEITIVDTSSLFYFYRVGLFDLFNKLYGHITVPEAVKNEINEGQIQGEDVPQLESYSWVEIRSANPNVARAGGETTWQNRPHPSNSPMEVSKNLSFCYDIGNNYEPLSNLCHVVYATKG